MSGAAWEQFWKKVYKYVTEHSLPSFDVLFYVLSVPSVIHLSSNQVIRELERVAGVVGLPKNQPVKETRLLNAILVAGEALDRYSKKKKFPKLFHDSLAYLYSLIIKDFSKRKEEYTFEEAFKGGENLASPYIQARSWFVINAVVNNSHMDKVRRIIEKSKKEEIPPILGDKKTPISLVVNSYLQGDRLIVEWVEEQIKKFGAGKEAQDEMVSFIGGRREGNKAVFPLKVSRFLFALLLSFLHWQRDLQALKDKALLERGKLLDKIKKLQEEKKVLREKNKSLKAALANAVQPRKEKIYIEPEAELKERHEREIEKIRTEMKEEAEFWKEVAEKALQEREEEEKPLEPLPERVRIAYYGRLTERLKGLFEKYNLEAEEYSPVSPTEEVPDMPIVFNISYAAHKVRFKVGDRNVILVRGSNAERILRRVVEKLLILKKGGG